METTETPWRALPVLLAGAFMVVLDFFIVNVALPSIATGTHATESSLEWVVAGYGLAFAALLITAGRLGDAHGRRKVYVIGLSLFTLASAACGLAPSPTTLILARVAQGAAGGIVMPQVLAIIGVSFRGEDYIKALSIYGVVLGLAAVGGQIIGGALVESPIGWRGCFLINVPVGIAALLIAPRTVAETAKQWAKLDVASAALLAVGLTAVLLPLIEGRRVGWPLWTWACLAAAPFVLAAFVKRQRRENPLLDLTLLHSRTFTAGLVTQFCLSTAQASFFVYLALYLQGTRGLSAIQAGLVFTVVAVAYVAASGPAPKLTAKHGHAVIAAGGATLTAGMLTLAATTDSSLVALFPGLRAGRRRHRPVLHAADHDGPQGRRPAQGGSGVRRAVDHAADRLRARRRDHRRRLLRPARPDRPRSRTACSSLRSPPRRSW